MLRNVLQLSKQLLSSTFNDVFCSALLRQSQAEFINREDYKRWFLRPRAFPKASKALLTSLPFHRICDTARERHWRIQLDLMILGVFSSLSDSVTRISDGLNGCSACHQCSLHSYRSGSWLLAASKSSAWSLVRTLPSATAEPACSSFCWNSESSKD